MLNNQFLRYYIYGRVRAIPTYRVYRLYYNTSMVQELLSLTDLWLNIIVNAYCFSTGEYHKYDSIVYPKKTRVSRSWRERLTSTLSGLFGWKKAHNGDEEFIPLTFLEMSKVCLNIYLGNYRSMICDGNFQHDLNLVQVSNNITCVFSCLRDYWIEAGGTGQMVQPKPNEFKEVSALCGSCPGSFPHCLHPWFIRGGGSFLALVRQNGLTNLLPRPSPRTCE